MLHIISCRNDPIFIPNNELDAEKSRNINTRPSHMRDGCAEVACVSVQHFKGEKWCAAFHSPLFTWTKRERMSANNEYATQKTDIINIKYQYKYNNNVCLKKLCGICIWFSRIHQPYSEDAPTQTAFSCCIFMLFVNIEIITPFLAGNGRAPAPRDTHKRIGCKVWKLCIQHVKMGGKYLPFYRIQTVLWLLFISMLPLSFYIISLPVYIQCMAEEDADTFIYYVSESNNVNWLKAHCYWMYGLFEWNAGKPRERERARVISFHVLSEYLAMRTPIILNLCIEINKSLINVCAFLFVFFPISIFRIYELRFFTRLRTNWKGGTQNLSVVSLASLYFPVYWFIFVCFMICALSVQFWAISIGIGTGTIHNRNGFGTTPDWMAGRNEFYTYLNSIYTRENGHCIPFYLKIWLNKVEVIVPSTWIVHFIQIYYINSSVITQ